MNWKTVYLIVNANRKAYRTIPSAKLRRYYENKLTVYGEYILFCVIGILIGYLVGNFYSASNATLQTTILDGATYVFVSIPTIALLYGVIFTLINKAQQIGIKISAQPIYWFPISWQEHTLASIITSLIGAPLAITLLISSAILTASVFVGLIPLALLTVLALAVSLLLSSVTTEALKILQTRLLGAVTKVAGRGAIYLRLAIMISTMLAFYIIYFVIYSLVYNHGSPIFLFETIANGQKMLWFIPYVWPGMILSTFTNNLGIGTVSFFLATLVLIAGIFFIATYTNTRFGLYELPTIRLSGRTYTPKISLLEKMGFSSIEAALMKKDYKTIIRRPELGVLFVFPIMILVSGFIPFLSGAQSDQSMLLDTIMFFAMITLFPSMWVAGFLGSMLTGLEGSSVWYLFSSPISAKVIVKSKFFFTVFCSLVALLLCGVIGSVIFRPTLLYVAVVLFEAIFLIVTISTVSVAIGIKGADFRGNFPYNRAIKRKESWLHVLMCIATGLGVVAPIVPYVLGLLGSNGMALFPAILIPGYYAYFGLFMSGIIATITTYIFYKIALDNAEQMLAKPETI
ncbi:MAG: hypothetical protein LBQ98_08430 [Nitrososphaerota archaeon]|jgi:hypothetical protein|nr:hypothetical protein [Nitrososphaerota archaeon]